MPIIEKNIHNLKFQNNEDEILSFSKFLGKYLILYFYPRDNTSGCTKEAKDFSNLKLEFDSLNTIVIGISSDTYESHNKFISKHGLKIELISDIDNNLCQYFGVWVKKICMEKSLWESKDLHF
ncbi:peroxiredoxin [Amylibacter sp.]|nr:peroxiredoxin [Amylibacter sp.]